MNYASAVRIFAILALLMVAGCASRGPVGEPYLDRTTYQKIYVTSYSGAGGTPETARGTRYQSGSVSSASADWARWPVGTIFRVLATGDLYEVDDFTDNVVGRNEILLYKPLRSNVASSPRQFVTIEVITWGSPRKSAAILERSRSSTAKRILAELAGRYPAAVR